MTDEKPRPGGNLSRVRRSLPAEVAPRSAGGARPWAEVKAKARAADPTWDAPDRVARRQQAREELLSAVNGGRLAALRKEAGLTQVQLASATGLSQARISQIERGGQVSLDVLRTYVTGLGGQLEVVARLGATILRIA